MKMTRLRIKRERLRKLGAAIAVILAISLALFLGEVVVSPDALSAGNHTTRTFVNVTNTEPIVTGIVVSPRPTVTLNPGNVTTVTCNATVWDYNGYGDVRVINGTFYLASGGYTWDSVDDNNTHYTNASCGTCAQYDAGSTNASCICSFPVQYYADNGTWNCNVTVQDIGGLFPTETPINFTRTGTDNTNISALVALDVPGILNYGNLSVTQTSSAKTVNITNIGNRDINISLYAFGGINESAGYNLSMICPIGTIPIENERFGFQDTADPSFAAMHKVNTSALITNITIARITNETSKANNSNHTIWKLSIPLSVGGYCNGSIVFIAADTLTN